MPRILRHENFAYCIFTLQLLANLKTEHYHFIIFCDVSLLLMSQNLIWDSEILDIICSGFYRLYPNALAYLMKVSLVIICVK